MIKKYLEKLLVLNKESIVKISFLDDPQINNLSDQSKIRLFEKSEEIGKEKALLLKKEYPTANFEQIIEKENGTISRVNEIPSLGYTMFAFFEEPNNITINMLSIEKIEEFMESNGLQSLFCDLSIKDLFLSHETFHFLEYHNPSNFFKRKHSLSHKKTNIKFKRRIVSLEEIGAMTFAQTFLSLDYNPIILNVLMLYVLYPQEGIKLAQKYLSL